ncbi:MAG: hypothetical protein IKW89_07510 [Bacteroidales bacterium]|nr:hypothetical protein [Bacteroidales bacterium]
MHPVLIKFFKAATTTSRRVDDPESIQTEALKRGFIIDPAILNEDVAAFIKTEAIDPNSTFYKTWDDVVSKDRWELFLDQVAHYTTTYGTRYTLEGNGYVPNDGAEAPDFTKYTVIRPISEDELFQRCKVLVSSGIALNPVTVKVVCEAIADYLKSHPFADFNMDLVRNREAVSILASKLGIRPSDPVALLRYIVFESTGMSLLIKNQDLVRRIKQTANQFDFNKLTREEKDALASVFYRFKDLFLAFRTHETRFYDTEKKEMVTEPSTSRKVINQIRRKAGRLHKPLKPGYWESILAGERPIEEISGRLGGLNAFKTVSLLQTVRERLLMMETPSKRMFMIRNGKTFVAPLEEASFAGMKDYYSSLADLFENKLVEILASKACSVKFPEKVVLACPSSEKNFIGNFPFGSWYPLSGHNFFGIYWRNEWGTHDFDISFVNLGGHKVGWNSVYNTGHAVYSGDMTNADPEASEILYCKGTSDDGIIFCNRYNGEQGSRFRFFFGQEEIVDMKRNYMADPNNMVVNEDLTSDLRQSMIAAVSGGKIFLMSLGVGNSRVSSGMDSADKSAIIARKSACFVDLKTLLLKSGFREVAQGEKADLDLEDLHKDTLISLFSPARPQA